MGGTRKGNTQTVTHLVVRSGSSGTAEWLLTHNSTRALVVDVEVTSGVTELVRGDAQRLTVGREDGAGKGVVGGVVDELAGLLEVGVFVDVDLSVSSAQMGYYT